MEEDDEMAKASHEAFSGVTKSYKDNSTKSSRRPKPRVVEVDDEEAGNKGKSEAEKEPACIDVLEAFPEAMGDIEAELKVTVLRHLAIITLSSYTKKENESRIPDQDTNI